MMPSRRMTMLVLVAWLSHWLVSAQSGVARGQDRDFPDDTAVDDVDAEEPYLRQLAVQSGGFGIGLAVIFGTAMLFHLMCFGHCCSFCRCGPCRYANVKKSACFLNQEWWAAFFILGLFSIVVTIVGAAVLFSSEIQLYEDIETGFDQTAEMLRDLQRLQCGGRVSESLRNGKMIEDLRRESASAGGENSSLDLDSIVSLQCDEMSVGYFLASHSMQARNISSSVQEMLLGVEKLAADLLNGTSSIRNVRQILLGIEASVLSLDGQTEAIRSSLQSLISGPGAFEGLLPMINATLRVGANDSIDLSSALQNGVNAEFYAAGLGVGLAPTIESLLVNGTRELLITDVSVVTTFATLARQNLNALQENINLEKDDIDGYRDQADDFRTLVSAGKTRVVVVTAAVMALCLSGMVVMLLGFGCKRRWPISSGAYMIFLPFGWIALLLGCAVAGSMLLYDSCGCEGSYTSESCETLLRVIETNLGDTTMSIADTPLRISSFVRPLVECPVVGDGSVAAYAQDVRNDSNFVDVLNVSSIFEFSDDFTPLKSVLGAAAPGVSSSQNDPLILSSVAFLRRTLFLAAGIEVTASPPYDFESDLSMYAFLMDDLQNPASLGTYYTNPPVSDPLLQARADRELLTALIANTSAAQRVYDELRMQQGYLAANATNTFGALRAVGAELNRTQSRLRRITERIGELVAGSNSINSRTPCGYLGRGYDDVAVQGACEKTYLNFEALVPGAIVALVGVLVGFFLMATMRDCVQIYQQQAEHFDETKQPLVRTDAKRKPDSVEMNSGAAELGAGPRRKEMKRADNSATTTTMGRILAS